MRSWRPVSDFTDLRSRSGTFGGCCAVEVGGVCKVESGEEGRLILVLGVFGARLWVFAARLRRVFGTRRFGG